MTEYTKDAALAVRCPDCASLAGQPCRNEQTAVMATLHNARYDRALLLHSQPVMHEVEVRELVADALERVLTSRRFLVSIPVALEALAAEIREPHSAVPHRKVG